MMILQLIVLGSLRKNTAMCLSVVTQMQMPALPGRVRQRPSEPATADMLTVLNLYLLLHLTTNQEKE